MRSRALDYRREVAVGEGRVTGATDVIVPVYGAAAELARCLASLQRFTDLERHRLIVVLDGPGQDEAESALGGVPENRRLVLRNPAREGFVRSVNRGLRASERDVVLLNSDVEVGEHWLENLRAAAASSPAVATVTPFSNDATLASLPQPFEANALPHGQDAVSFARLVERVAARSYPRIPTGVGMCLFIKRHVLDHLGPFDEGFGLGYGEENDFCFRALKAGFVHVLDDATFVYHAGHRSFGAERDARLAAAGRRMARRHPEYLPTIAAFMASDPLRDARARVRAALARPRPSPAAGPPQRVLHLVHGWPPWSSTGVETYARGLAVRQAGWREVAVHARVADPERPLGAVTELLDEGARVRLVVNNFLQRDPWSRNALVNRPLEADLARLVDEFRPDLAHVHHLAGHSLHAIDVLAARRVPFVYSIQDWWLPCARVNLLRPDRALCPGPGLDRCARCVNLTRVRPAALWNRLLLAHRRRLARRVLPRAAALVMGSPFVAESYERLGLLPKGSRHYVTSYGVELPPAPKRRAPTPPLRFGVLGSILPHKGIHVAVEAFREVRPEKATLEVWGDPKVSPAYTRELEQAASPAVRLAGGLPEERKDAVLSGFDVLVVPSLGLESFGLVVREALARGVSVLASRRGALLEAFEDGTCGAFFDPGSAVELRAWIDRLCERPEILAEWAARRPAVKSLDAHAGEIEAIYREALAGRRTDR